MGLQVSFFKTLPGETFIFDEKVSFRIGGVAKNGSSGYIFCDPSHAKPSFLMKKLRFAWEGSQKICLQVSFFVTPPRRNLHFSLLFFQNGAATSGGVYRSAWRPLPASPLPASAGLWRPLAASGRLRGPVGVLEEKEHSMRR